MNRNYKFAMFRALLCLSIFLLLPVLQGFALEQLQNTGLTTNTTGWTIDHRVIDNNSNMNTYNWTNADGNPVGSYYCYFNGSSGNRDSDLIFQQSFPGPAAQANVKIQFDHRDIYMGVYDNFDLAGTLRIDGSAGYPNETIAVTFFAENTTDTDNRHTGWQSDAVTALIDPVANYLYRIYIHMKADGGEELAVYWDNCSVNMSPSGLVATPNGSGVDLTWNPSTSNAVTLHGTSPYRVYRSTTSGGPYTQIAVANTNSYTDPAPLSAPVVYYTVTDVDSGGVVSPYSPEAMVLKFVVNDGLGPDIAYSFFEDRVECNWEHVPASILRYDACVGTSPGNDNVVPWTNVGLSDHAIFTGLSLASGTTYYCGARVVDLLGAVQSSGFSDGFLARRDQVLTDTASQTFFNNARVLDQIDLTTNAGRVYPKNFSGTGGAGYWRYSVPVEVEEPGVTERINAPCRIQLTIPGGQMNNVNEIRVADDKGNELPRYNLNTSTTAPDIVFLVNMAKGEKRTFWVYWGNTGVADPGYGFVMNSGDISINEWTPYYTRKNMPSGPENAPNGAPLGLATTNTDDGYTGSFNLPFPFYFYGTDLQNGWYLNINGNMARNQDGDYTNTWNEFIGGGFNKVIAPIWVDLMVRGLDDAGLYRDDLTDPTRVVFSWNCNRYNATDDIYYVQTVIYETGDIALRYRYLSPRGLIGPTVWDQPVNVAPNHTVGISNSDGTRYMTNTPLNIGIANSATAFYQCMDAFRGNYTVGTIIGGNVGTQVSVAEFQSMVFDSRTSKPDWQTLQYWAAGGADGQLKYSVRTGSTPLPDSANWSPWTVIATSNTNGSAAIPSPDLRFLQYKVEFQRRANGALPYLDEVRLIYGGISIDTISANTPSGVSQGQDNIEVSVEVRNFYTSPVNLNELDLTFDLGSYTSTLVSPALPTAIPAGGTIIATFSVDVWDESPIGTATIHAVATATVGALTFFDEFAQTPHKWWVRSKANLVITQVETAPTHVNKGQNGIPVRIHFENLGETPYTFDVASLTFSLGTYTQLITSPAIGTVINGLSSFTATVSVNILPLNPSGVAIIGATASGTNTFSGKITQDLVASITDSWTIQNPAQLVIEEVTASSTVYRGQTNTPVFIRVSNPGEAVANWTSSDLLSHFTLGTYDDVYANTLFPLAIPGGLESKARYGVDISPVSATGTSVVDADVTGTDKNTLFPISYSNALLPASWTILAEKINTFKDPSFLYPSSSFNKPVAGTTEVYARGEDLLPYGEFVVRWLDPSDVEVASSVPLTANASGTLYHEYSLTPASPFGDWTIQITNPVGTIVACENKFEVVSPADLTISMLLPSSVTIGQPFIASLTFINSGGAAISSGYASSLQLNGPGTAVITGGPNPAVINVDGDSQATMTWSFDALTAGNFSASSTAYGFDANSNVFLTSPAVTSNICVIQNPPNLAVQNVAAVPTVVYLNQKNLQVTVDVRNTGQATAIVNVASLSFTLGSFTQVLTSPALPLSIAAGVTTTLTYDVSVAPDSATGLSNFSAEIQYYDSNWPASVTLLNALTPNDSWTVDPVGIVLSAESDFDPLQDNFNQTQTVYIRASGLTPGSQWYRVRLYNSQIPQAGTGPTGWENVSPPLAADVNGYVDYLRTLPVTAAIGDWSVIIEDDADSSSTSRGNMLGLQYFKVQNQGGLTADLTISPTSVFVGDNFTVTMVATNTVVNGSTIASAVPELLTLAGGAVGDATLLSGPTPAYVDVVAQSSKKITWEYKAIQDTGLAGNYRLTSGAAYSLQGRDLNTNATVTSNLATSNNLVIYRRAMDLSSATLDFGSILCGDATMENTGVVNTGNYPLDDVQWITTDLNGPGSEKIGKVNLSFSPSPVGGIAAGATVPASGSLFVPYNQPAGTYIATMSLFNDRNANLSFDIDEVYDLFQFVVTVPPCKRIFIVNDRIDLGGWSIGETTSELQLHAFSGGNLPLDNLKFKQITATNTFPIFLNPVNPGPLAKIGSIVASVSSTVSVGPNGSYIATWTLWNDEDSDDVVDASEASDTFQVSIQVGGKSFSLLPSPVDAGVGTPSSVVTGFGPTLNNTGMLALNKLKSVFSPLTDGLGNSIASSGIGINPAISLPIDAGVSVPVEMRLFVPAGTAAGLFSGTQIIFEDNNLNGVWDPSEASATFVLQVDVPLVRLVQVLIPTVDIGGVAPGNSRTVSFPCRNIGNVTLTDLRWEKQNLVSGGNTIPPAQLSFPPTEPFTAVAGQFFNHDIQLTVPLAQAFGSYLSVAPNYWIYDDFNPANLARNADEAESTFKVSCQIGEQKIDILEPSLSSTGDPNAQSTSILFNVKNIGSLSLSNPKATGTVLIPSAPGPVDISASRNVFVPSSLGAILSTQTKQGQWHVNIPANASAGVYLAQLIVWEDSNSNNQIDPAEATDTVSLQLTVNAAKVIDVVQTQLDLGWGAENTTVQGQIEVLNAGNVDLDEVRPLSAAIVFGFANIPAGNITFNPVSLGNLTVGASALATVTVVIDSNQADGTYVGNQRVYDDYNAANSLWDATEEFDLFEILLRIGKKSVYETNVSNPPVDLGQRNPGGSYSQSFTVFSGTSVPLSKVKWKIDSPLSIATYSMPVASLSFSPAGPFSVAGGGNRLCSALVDIGNFAPPGNYVATASIWEDDNSDGVIQSAEASGSFNVLVEVNPLYQIDIIDPTIDFGQIAQGATKTMEIGFRNLGNTELTNFSWSFSPLNFGAFSIPLTGIVNLGIYTKDPVPPGEYGTSSVDIVVDSAQELGTYGPDGPQTLSATLPGAPSDTCDFTCEIIAGVTGGLNIASGSISQEIATTTFSALAPDNRFALSVWVCPGSGSASLAFVMADAAGEPVTTIGVKIDANGNLTPTAGLVDYGVIEAVPFKHPDHPTEPDLTFYRVYITFDLTYTEPMPYASTHVVLQNNSLGVGDPQAVWFDGIQLEKLSDTDTPKPSSFHPYGHLISPTLEKTIGGDNSYYEW